MVKLANIILITVSEPSFELLSFGTVESPIIQWKYQISYFMKTSSECGVQKWGLYTENNPA